MNNSISDPNISFERFLKLFDEIISIHTDLKKYDMSRWRFSGKRDEEWKSMADAQNLQIGILLREKENLVRKELERLTIKIKNEILLRSLHYAAKFDIFKILGFI